MIALFSILLYLQALTKCICVHDLLTKEVVTQRYANNATWTENQKKKKKVISEQSEDLIQHEVNSHCRT